MLRFGPTVFVVVLAFAVVACSGKPGDQGPPTADPTQSDDALSDLDALLGNAPTNAELPEDGKFDAVYPAQFDLVATQSRVRSQGRRGVCSIFSTVALMEHLYIKEGTIAEPDFSEQFLQWSTKFELQAFQNTGGSSARENLRAINQYGIVMEEVWPYESGGWTTSDDPRCTGDNRPTVCYTNGEPTAAMRAAARWKLPAGRYINSRERSIKAYLTENRIAAVAGMTFFYQAWNHGGSPLTVNRDYYSEGYVLYPNETDKEKSLEKRAGHSILIVGWDDELEVSTRDASGNVVVDGDGNPVKEKGFWLIKNSWGTSGFGIRNPHGRGYGWLSYRYVREYASVYSAKEPDLDLRETCDDGQDNDFNGDVDCDDAGCADDPACQVGGLSYGANPALPITDNDASGIASVITVTEPGQIDGVTVSVDISHPYIGDLIVTLRSPSGTVVTLHEREGNSTDDLVKVYRPTEFSGETITGDWTLVVADRASSDTGTLNRWSIAFRLGGALPPEICDDGVDNDGNGDLDCADAACASLPACQTASEYFETNATAAAIPDNDPTGVTSTIDIAGGGTITQVLVDIDITHTYRGDLIVKLEHPSGAEVVLHDQEGSGLDNLVRSFTPTDFNGLSVTGTWTLTVIDTAEVDTGTLNSWSLLIETN